MHISDVVLECAQQCARLSRECTDKEIGIALQKISVRLFVAATQDAALQENDDQATSQSHATDVEVPTMMPRKIRT